LQKNSNKSFEKKTFSSILKSCDGTRSKDAHRNSPTSSLMYNKTELVITVNDHYLKIGDIDIRALGVAHLDVILQILFGGLQVADLLIVDLQEKGLRNRTGPNHKISPAVNLGYARIHGHHYLSPAAHRR
jgi:hypothetical protein